jgi:hypothetical protein
MEHVCKQWGTYTKFELKARRDLKLDTTLSVRTLLNLRCKVEAALS